MQSFDEIKKKSLLFSTEAQKIINHIAYDFGNGESSAIVTISIEDSNMVVYVQASHPFKTFKGEDVLIRPFGGKMGAYCTDLFEELKSILEGHRFQINMRRVQKHYMSIGIHAI